MGCKECGKPKCNGECGCKSPKVLQINNPPEYITFHKVSIPAAMGDSTTNPPKIGAYRNALVYYEADHTSWMYSTDGIPTLITGEQGPQGPKGDKGDKGDPTKTSQLINDSDYTTNAALNAGLATKADLSALQTTDENVAANTAALAKVPAYIELIAVDVNSATRWYKLTTLPKRSLTSYAARVQLSGCIGEYYPNASAQIDITIASRGVLKVTGDYYAVGDTVANYADIEIYDQEDGTADVYIKAITSWVTVKLKAIFIDGCANEFNENTYTTSQPSGTLSWALSTAPDVQKNIGGTISADITGDAATVNGHTVEADVPSDALFTDTVYDDTIISNQVSSMSAEIGALDARVDGLASGSPLVASSTSEMTDTTRVYVNTTDGKWYYYDGSDWVVGGVYQASVDSDTVDLLDNYDALQKNLGIEDYLTNLSFELGAVNGGSDGGVIIASTTRLTTPEFYRFAMDDTVFTINGYQFALALYDKNGAWIGYYNTSSGSHQNSPSYIERVRIGTVISAVPTTNRLRVLLKNSEGTTIQVSDGANLYIEPSEKKALSLVSQSKYKESIVFNDIWENIIITGSGEFLTNNARLSSRYFFPIKYIRNIEVAEDSGMEFGVGVYDDSYTWVGYLQNSDGDALPHSNKYFTALDVSRLNPDYKYRIYARYTDLSNIATSEGVNILFKLKDCNVDYEDGGIVITNDVNAGNHIWTDYGARLAFGMNTTNAPVPTISNQQFVNFGTFILMKASSRNRWGFHVLEAYDNTNYNRITMLVDKHTSEFDSKRSAELYYYTGANHHASSYGYFKLGSDVAYHSFLFNRDKMLAAGEIDCRFPVTLARISPANDLDPTYETVAEADAAYEPENQATSNIPCLKYIALKNAANGCMWYDKDRHKVVVKINGKWHDVNTTEVPDGTYGF